MSEAGHRRTVKAATAALALWPLWSGIALPQPASEDGSLLYTFGFSTGVRASDNRQLTNPSAGNSTYSDTKLSFGAAAKTRGQTLDFLISNRFRFSTGDGAPPNEPFLPELRLNYARESLNARLTALASLDSRDLSIDDLPEDISNPNQLITDDGIELRQNLSIGIETGLAAPLGADARVFTSRTDYFDTTDPDNYDRATVGGSVGLTLRPDKVTSIRLGYSLSEYEAENTVRTQRTTESLDLSANRQLDPLTSVYGSFGYKTVDEEQRAIGPGFGNDSEGFIASAGLSRALTDGRIGVDLSHDVTGAGDRTDFSVTRAFTLPAGSLILTVGVTEPEGASYQPTGEITYLHERSRQNLRLTAASRIVVDDDDSVQRLSRIGLNYDFEINERNSLGLGLDYARTDKISGLATIREARRATATASYTHALTEDWDLRTGYSYRFRDEKSGVDASSNEIFVRIGRDFSWRP